MPTRATEQKQSHKSARWNRELGRMQTIEETEDGTTTAVYCRDGSRRNVHLTGKEGAILAACEEAKLLLVEVLIPKSYGRRGRQQVEAIMGGMDLTRDLTMEEFIGYDQAEKMHAYSSVDPCEKTVSVRQI